MKILIAHNAYRHRGGEDLVVEAETEMLRANGHEVIELRRDNSSMRGGKLSLALDSLWSRSAHDELASLIAARKPDVIHAHNTFPQLSPAIYWSAARAGVPVVQTLHNFRLLCAQAMFLRNGTICEDCLGKLPWRGVVRKCYRNSRGESAALVSMLALHRRIGTYTHKVTRYIALSEFSRRRFVEGGLPAERISVKPNFVEIAPQAERARAHGLYVGRLSLEKGLSMLVEALAHTPGVHVDIVGDGPEREALNGHPQLSLLGWAPQEQVYERMRGAAYLLLPSVAYEQFPRVLAEAFACGLPIIGARQGPLQELIRDGETGLLFEPGSAKDLAEKVKFAHEHAAALRVMGQNARVEYEEKYSPQRNHQMLMGIYAGAVAAINSETMRSR